MDSEPYDDRDYEKPKRTADDEIYGAPDIEGATDDDAPRSRRPGRRPRWLILGCLLTPLVCCGLLVCSLVVGGGVLYGLVTRTEVTASGTETLAVEGDGPLTLVVDNRVGSVEVRPGPVGEVTLRFTKRAYGTTRARADKELANIAVSLTQDANGTVRAEVDTDRTDNSFFSIANNVKLEITAPPSLALEVRNNVGSVTVEDVQARSLDLRSNTGSVIFRGTLDPAAASTYLLETNTGEIELRLPSDVYAEIDAHTDVGDLSIGRGFDAMDARTDDRKGPSATWIGVLGTGSGSAPTVRLRTNTGAINVRAE